MSKEMRVSLILCLAALIGGCERSAPQKSTSRPLNVIATVYPLADLARQVGGDSVEVSWVVETGQSLKGVKPDERLRNRLRSSDIVLMGDVTEAWATEGSGSGEHYARILRLEALPIARHQPQQGYLWLDPMIARQTAIELSSRLRALRPDKAGESQDRTDALTSAIDSMVREYDQRLLNARPRRLLVLGDDFAPFLRRFSMEPIATIDVAPTRLTPENIRLIQHISRQNDTKLLVLAADIPAAVVDDLRVRSGLQIVMLDALGTSAVGGRNTYLDLMKWNLEQLVSATTLQ